MSPKVARSDADRAAAFCSDRRCCGHGVHIVEQSSPAASRVVSQCRARSQSHDSFCKRLTRKPILAVI